MLTKQHIILCLKRNMIITSETSICLFCFFITSLTCMNQPKQKLPLQFCKGSFLYMINYRVLFTQHLFEVAIFFFFGG